MARCWWNTLHRGLSRMFRSPRGQIICRTTTFSLRPPTSAMSLGVRHMLATWPFRQFVSISPSVSILRLTLLFVRYCAGNVRPIDGHVLRWLGAAGCQHVYGIVLRSPGCFAGLLVPPQFVNILRLRRTSSTYPRLRAAAVLFIYIYWHLHKHTYSGTYTHTHTHTYVHAHICWHTNNTDMHTHTYT